MDFQQISENNKLLLVSTVNGLQERKKDNKILHISDISHLSASDQIPNSSRTSPSLILICTVDGGPKSGLLGLLGVGGNGKIVHWVLGSRTTFLWKSFTGYWGQDKEKV